MTLHQDIIAAIRSAGRIGASANDVGTELGQETCNLTGPILTLVKKGHLKRLPWKTRGDSGKMVFMYATPENYTERAQVNPEPKPIDGSIAAGSWPWPTSECRVVYRNGIKHTIGPSATFDRRYQLDRETRIKDGFMDDWRAKRSMEATCN